MFKKLKLTLKDTACWCISLIWTLYFDFFQGCLMWSLPASCDLSYKLWTWACWYGYTRDNPGMGHCQFMRKLCKIEEIQLQIWKGPLYNLSKYAVSFGLGPQIRVHRPLHFPWWPPVFANGPLFLSILHTFY